MKLGRLNHVGAAISLILPGTGRGTAAAGCGGGGYVEAWRADGSAVKPWRGRRIYAYFLFVGNWKKSAPETIIGHKRELDRHVYAYRPLFSPDFFTNYNDFMSATFRTFGETSEDNRAEITSTYDVLLDCLAADLGIASRTRRTTAE